jgi:hypothetical protein
MKTQPVDLSKPIRIGPPPPPTPPLETIELTEILGRILPVDFLAALNGERGAALHLAGGAP